MENFRENFGGPTNDTPPATEESISRYIHECNDIGRCTRSELNSLLNDTVLTRSFRSSLSSALFISEHQSENNALQNFGLGIIDGLMGLPAIIELYTNNRDFRDILWNELRNISLRDIALGVYNSGENLLSGTAYEKGKASVEFLLLFTGIGGILRQFGVSIIRTAQGGFTLSTQASSQGASTRARDIIESL